MAWRQVRRTQTEPLQSHLSLFLTFLVFNRLFPFLLRREQQHQIILGDEALGGPLAIVLTVSASAGPAHYALGLWWPHIALQAGCHPKLVTASRPGQAAAAAPTAELPVRANVWRLLALVTLSCPATPRTIVHR